ncbi:hypothetical protein PG995_004807 [Apiospora arundinis]
MLYEGPERLPPAAFGVRAIIFGRILPNNWASRQICPSNVIKVGIIFVAFVIVAAGAFVIVVSIFIIVVLVLVVLVLVLSNVTNSISGFGSGKVRLGLKLSS